MRMKYFGDSYDIVKKSLLSWLNEFGEWAVHPMFTEEVSSKDISAIERFLGAKVISPPEVLTCKTDRTNYFSCAGSYKNVLFDPDTGLKKDGPKGGNIQNYLFATELTTFLRTRPDALALVFDQSHSHGRANGSISEKQVHLFNYGVCSFSYTSHACFTVASTDNKLVNNAYQHILSVSCLPELKFIPPENT